MVVCVCGYELFCPGIVLCVLAVLMWCGGVMLGVRLWPWCAGSRLLVELAGAMSVGSRVGHSWRPDDCFNATACI